MVFDRKAYSKAYYQNKKASFKAYRQKNRDKILEHAKIYRINHKEQIKAYLKEYNKAWYLKNKDKVLARARIWKLNNRDKVKLNIKAWYHKNKHREDVKEKLKVRAYTAYHKLKPKIKCEMCGTNENLTYHHINYTYNPEDVKILCENCHHSKLQILENKMTVLKYIF